MSSYNEVIRNIAELGLFPVIICLVVLRKMIYRWYQEVKKDTLAKALFCGLMSLLVISMFHEVFRFVRVAIPFVILAALCDARINQINQKENSNEKDH